jgi:hypothetical protein
MREKRLDFRDTHGARMALAMEQDEVLYPVNVLLLGSDAVVLDAYAGADALEQTGTAFGDLSCHFLGNTD